MDCAVGLLTVLGHDLQLICQYWIGIVDGPSSTGIGSGTEDFRSWLQPLREHIFYRIRRLLCCVTSRIDAWAEVFVGWMPLLVQPRPDHNNDEVILVMTVSVVSDNADHLRAVLVDLPHVRDQAITGEIQFVPR